MGSDGVQIRTRKELKYHQEVAELSAIYAGLSMKEQSKLMALARRMASATGAVAANTRNQER